MVEIIIPSVGIAMEEALVVRWIKQPGDAVAVDDPVAEIETDKATMDVVSPAAGTLGPHLFEPGAIVAVGTAIVHVLDGSEPAPDPAAGGAPEADPVEAGAEVEPGAASGRPPGVEAAQPPPGARAAHTLSPRARRLAMERERGAAAAPAPGDGCFRELIAARVAESWREIPHFAVSRDVDAGAMLAVLVQVRAAGFEPAPTLTDLLLRALALALRETGVRGQVDVGLAVATPAGVVIPVVRDVLGQGAAELAAARSSAVERARSGRLGREDLDASARSTLSNLGSFGVDRFTGIIALGQTSLLTVGRALPRVVADASGAIRVRTSFDATLNADHRTIDGAEAARLLVAFSTAAERMTADL
jgi:pyruvate dehydrogenase E2 component (dihydrolipoamide acetyltransferase)